LFNRYHDVINEAALPDFLVVAYISMVRVLDARGRSAGAEEILNEAESICHAAGWSRRVRDVNWERVRRALRAGAIDQAMAIADANRFVPDPLPSGWVPFASDIECATFGEIRLSIRQNNFDDAGLRLDAESKRHRGRTFRQIKLHLLRALRAGAIGERSTAHRCLRTALRLGQSGHFIRCFLEEGDSILVLIREEYQSLLEGNRGAGGLDDERDFVELLLRASGTDLNNFRHASVEIQPLTDRERELLTLIASGFSNKDMAQRLFVSENTVKFHLKNVFGKLSVNSRIQAITAARQMGLLKRNTSLMGTSESDADDNTTH